MLTMCILRLKAHGVLTTRLRGQVQHLRHFWHENGRMLLRSSIFSVSEIYIYNFPYFFVPAFYGLGAPTIILDTAFKVFRGGSVAYSAACDVSIAEADAGFHGAGCPGADSFDPGRPGSVRDPDHRSFTDPSVRWANNSLRCCSDPPL